MIIRWVGTFAAVTFLAALIGCAPANSNRDPLYGKGPGSPPFEYPFDLQYDLALRKQARAAMSSKVGLLRQGMHNDQVSQLLGPPQYVGSHNEWSYLLAFESGGDATPCQLEIWFDPDSRLSSRRWLPDGCSVFEHVPTVERVPAIGGFQPLR